MSATPKAVARAIRAASSASQSVTAKSRRVLPPSRGVFQHQQRRGYASSSTSAPGNAAGHLFYGGATATLLAAAGLYATQRPTQAESLILQDSAAQGQKGSAPFISATAKDYQAVYDAIAEKLIDEDDYDDGSYGPILLRLGWHCSGTYDAATGTGGSNGATMRFAPESDHGPNNGLKNARDFLEPIKQRFPWVSYSDLWTLGAVCAVQEMGGPDIAWRPGRQDHDASFCTPDGRLPLGAKEQNHLRAIFGRMGFDDGEIVALSGAHAVGRCHAERSGFEGPWTFSPITLTNDYFRLLLDEEWHERDWKGPRQFQDDKTKTLMMLPTDYCLVQDAEFKRHVQKYAASQEVFFADFARVVTKLLELGVPFAAGEEARMILARTE